MSKSNNEEKLSSILPDQSVFNRHHAENSYHDGPKPPAVRRPAPPPRQRPANRPRLNLMQLFEQQDQGNNAGNLEGKINNLTLS